MLSVAPDEDDTVSVTFHPCSLRAFVGLLCPMLQGEETKLEVEDVHAVCNLDVMYCAFVVFNVENEGPMSLDGKATLDSLHGLASVENEVFELSGCVAIMTEAKKLTPMRKELVSNRIIGRLEYPLLD